MAGLVLGNEAGELHRRLAALGHRELFHDPLADGVRHDKLGMLLGGDGFLPMEGFQVFVPVLLLGLEHDGLGISPLPKGLYVLSTGFDSRGVVVQAEGHLFELGVLLQHPQQGVV